MAARHDDWTYTQLRYDLQSLSPPLRTSPPALSSALDSFVANVRAVVPSAEALEQLGQHGRMVVMQVQGIAEEERDGTLKLSDLDRAASAIKTELRKARRRSSHASQVQGQEQRSLGVHHHQRDAGAYCALSLRQRRRYPGVTEEGLRRRWA
ncbi:hypothetical protein JCM10449v2_002615 [Rhodotorula kratochvilovae]